MIILSRALRDLFSTTYKHGGCMNIDSVLDDMRQERARLDRAIGALEGVNGRPGRHRVNGKRKMSAAGRARIAAAQRARWAKLKRKAPK